MSRLASRSRFGWALGPAGSAGGPGFAPLGGVAGAVKGWAVLLAAGGAAYAEAWPATSSPAVTAAPSTARTALSWNDARMRRLLGSSPHRCEGRAHSRTAVTVRAGKRTKQRRRSIGAAGVLAAALLAGCGSDDDGRPSARPLVVSAAP